MLSGLAEGADFVFHTRKVLKVCRRVPRARPTRPYAPPGPGGLPWAGRPVLYDGLGLTRTDPIAPTRSRPDLRAGAVFEVRFLDGAVLSLRPDAPVGAAGVARLAETFCRHMDLLDGTSAASLDDLPEDVEGDEGALALAFLDVHW